MCIIVHHPVGQELPCEDTLSTCWLGNPDGAGIMYRKEDKSTRIIKGLMTWHDFKECYDSLRLKKDQEFALHFRIATSGGVIPANCHPFPVTPIVKELQMLNCEFDSAMMHNGVLGKGDEKRKLSDTMLFIMNTLSNPFIMENAANEVIMDYLQMKTEGSRLLLYTPTHTITTGFWHTFEGCLYSNRSFEDWGSISIQTGLPPRNYDVVCPECASDNIDFLDFDVDSVEEIYQCLNCYTLMDIDGWRYFEDDKKAKKIIKQAPSTVRRKKKGGFKDAVRHLSSS